jgi:predicted TIM-barrel fold metal-dependent hydrolase
MTTTSPNTIAMMPPGSVDCDVHIGVPDNAALLPYLEPYWREQVTSRGIEALDLATYPPKNPLSCRHDWRPGKGKPGTDLGVLQRNVLDDRGVALAVCHTVYGGQVVLNADLGAAICKAVNRWVAKEWLDKEKRLRASIVVPMQEPGLAVAEIDRCAADSRFVQVLLLASGDMPLGKRYYWPIYEAAARYDMPVGIHPGHAGRFAPTYVGWPSSHLEDYAAQSQAIQGQLLSLLYEGVFGQFPTLKLVLMESGVSWLPGFCWRADNTWRAMRHEVPWLARSPSETLHEHLRLTTQPFDVSDDPATLDALLQQFPAENMLLYASDFPHFHFEGGKVLPGGISHDLATRIAVRNPIETYPRLSEASA